MAPGLTATSVQQQSFADLSAHGNSTPSLRRSSTAALVRHRCPQVTAQELLQISLPHTGALLREQGVPGGCNPDSLGWRKRFVNHHPVRNVASLEYFRKCG